MDAADRNQPPMDGSTLVAPLYLSISTDFAAGKIWSAKLVLSRTESNNIKFMLLGLGVNSVNF